MDMIYFVEIDIFQNDFRCEVFQTQNANRPLGKNTLYTNITLFDLYENLHSILTTLADFILLQFLIIF